MSVVDLRSDTVTKPTPAMRQAMYEAEVGDDGYGDDPTVNAMQERAAEIFGKEAALFVISGTMGNLVALLTHCGRGDEVIMGHLAHSFIYEGGGVSALGGVQVHTVPNLPDGTMDLEAVQTAIREENPHFPRTSLICVENTHNRCGGVALSSKQLAAVKAIADRHDLPVHMDGARVFNAAIAVGEPVTGLTDQVDTLQVCLSKGLCAPVGSLLCGSADFIAEAHRNRQVVGGGMRQAGVIAAAGLVALNEMVDRLADDHANARRLARGLDAMDGYQVDLDSVQTNIVMAKVVGADVARVVAALRKRGVLVNQIDARHFRAVTHYGVEREDIETALQVAEQVIA